jgi:transposase
MNFVGIDLHKKSISVCVVNQEREVLHRRGFAGAEPERIATFLKELGGFQAVMEATSSYEWLFQLLEPLAQRVWPAHPNMLRVIAESTTKCDALDAQVRAEFLALDMIPQAYRPTPRQRRHRRLVRQRVYLHKRITSVRCKIRWILTDYNAARSDLFTAQGLEYLAQGKGSSEDRVVLEPLIEEWKGYVPQLVALDKRLRDFAQSAPAAEAEARAVRHSIPYVGPVTIDAVVSERGDVRGFRSQKRAAAYAGLVPGQGESAGQRRETGITQEGSRLLRRVLVETAWRRVYHCRRWGSVFEGLCQRRGRKRAIVAVARRLLCVMVAMLQSGRRYQAAMV